MASDTMPPQPATTLSMRAIDDLAWGVSKLASGWLKFKMDSNPNWVAGSFKMDLAAMFDEEIKLQLGDYMRIAEKAQAHLNVYISRPPYSKTPGVAVDLARGKRMLFISFLDNLA
jgi:hypothetical protein